MIGRRCVRHGVETGDLVVQGLPPSLSPSTVLDDVARGGPEPGGRGRCTVEVEVVDALPGDGERLVHHRVGIDVRVHHPHMGEQPALVLAHERGEACMGATVRLVQRAETSSHTLNVRQRHIGYTGT